MKYCFAFCYCLLSILNLSGYAKLRLPRLVSNDMVLQRDKPLKIWGWATPNAKVSIQWKEVTREIKCGADGKWFVTLLPVKAGGPYTMVIESEGKRISLSNILIGDVWVCGGQSNMELPMSRVQWKYPEIYANATNKEIRQFIVPMYYNFKEPSWDVSSGNWEPVTKQTIGRFSAVAYFFATALYKKYHVPIGLIKASVGGTPAEAWLNEQALQEYFPQAYQDAIEFKDDSYLSRVISRNNEITTNWYHALWKGDAGIQEDIKWYDTAYDDKDWASMSLPGYWDERGFRNVHGAVWFRKEVDIPARMANKPIGILLGNIVDRDSVFVNGVFVATTPYQYPPRRYVIPAGLLRPGKNQITIRVINSAFRGGFIKDKPYRLVSGHDTITLQGNWKYKVGFDTQPSAPTTSIHYKPLGLFNGMIAPLTTTAIKGVIWYQGEGNAAKPKLYEYLFPMVIRSWRDVWHEGEFPFLFVQLANFMEAKPQPAESDWAMLRESQLKTLFMPNTGMAVAIDIGEWNDVHPLNKADVGKRLALAAQHVAYGNNLIAYSGPVYQSIQIKGKKAILRFDHTNGGLVAKDSDTLRCFAIAGSDKRFVWAQARIKGSTVEVWSDAVPDPVFVRYAWADNPVGPNLYNGAGLPASPFRTDK